VKLQTSVVTSSSLTVQTKTTTYTALVTDDVILCSGSAFTVNLAAASTWTKKLVIKKTDSSLTNIITIDGNASETIDGALTRKLVTEGESITLASDGSNIYIVDRNLPAIINTFTSVLNGSSVNPAKPSAGNITVDQAVWIRERNGMRIHWTYKHTSAGTAGTGDYIFILPSSQTIDSGAATIHATYGSVLGNGIINSNTDFKSNYTQHGNWKAYQSTGIAFWYNSTLSANNFGDIWRSGGTAQVSMDSTNVMVVMTAWVPITGWDQ